MARKIAFLNYKGGVGKTSLIVNLAACLAKAGQRVLLFDFDTQSNASIWLLRLERWNKINNTNVGAVYSIFEPGTAKLKDLVVKDVVEGRTGRSCCPASIWFRRLSTSWSWRASMKATRASRRIYCSTNSCASWKAATISSFSTARQTSCTPLNAASFPPMRSMFRRIPTR